MKKNILGNRKLVLSIEEPKHQKQLFYTVTELSDRWGYHKHTIRAWCKTGKIKATKFGNNTSEYRIAAAAVDKIETEGF